MTGAGRSVARGLVIQTAFYGDVILTTPLIRRAAERLGAPVDVVVIPAAAPVLADNPHIRDVLTFDKRGKDRGLAGFLKLARALRRRRYAVAYLAQASARSSLLALAARIPRRIGFRAAPGAWMYTHAVATRAEPHQVERLLALADGAPDRREPEIYPGSAERTAVDALLAEAGIAGSYVVLAPAAHWGTKRWPYFPGLAQALAPESALAIVGGSGDRADARAIRTALGAATPVADATGRLSILAAGELIRRAELLVSNDSAPVHLASAVGTPTIEIYGPTVPLFGFAPRAPLSRIVEPDPLPCRPCHHHGPAVCPLLHHKCMRDTPISRVLAEVRTLRQILRIRARSS
ncbi:MAG: glycosyltransferase family 9 protein [Gemmatimonadetes bacterium]|nr:glycosyltransferase family 9 protein [Gemmatimonadota bacterium]